ncbi:portal protein [Rhizobium phage V1VFA-S]|nr:portal protein [Rhizobium phage V1VFA-S]
MPSTTAQNDAMREFFDRRHPGYQENLPHWRFLDACYRGGRDWFYENIFRYFKEGEKEFDKRVERAYRFNHTREVVELVQKYLFKGEITRNTADAPDVVTQFWQKAMRGGASIDQLMRLVSVNNSTGGRVAIVVDNNFQGEVEIAEGVTRPVSIAEAKAQNFRIYAYTVPVKDILDFAFDEDGDGELLWVKLREVVRDDKDPFYSTGELVERVRLWTRTGWELYQEMETGETTVFNGIRTPVKKVELVDFGYHELGFVPVYFADHTINENPYRVTGLIDDIAYLDRAVANYLSNLDAIIQDQTFSQLAIPSQAIQSGDDMFNKVLEMGTKRIFVYDAGAGSGSKPEYLSPDPKQAGVILAVINKIINEIYNTVGLAGERTKEDNAVGIDNSSGVAKAYDFERVNSLLLAKAQSCQNAENWMVKTVLAWAGEKPLKDDLVSYPTTFDIMGLNDELVTAEALAKLQGPIEVRREQMKSVVDKIFPQLKKELRSKLHADIDKWLEGTDLLMLPTSIGGTAKPAAAPNRQGEVTSKTPAKPATNKAAAK